MRERPDRAQPPRVFGYQAHGMASHRERTTNIRPHDISTDNHTSLAATLLAGGECFPQDRHIHRRRSHGALWNTHRISLRFPRTVIDRLHLPRLCIFSLRVHHGVTRIFDRERFNLIWHGACPLRQALQNSGFYGLPISDRVRLSKRRHGLIIDKPSRSHPLPESLPLFLRWRQPNLVQSRDGMS